MTGDNQVWVVSSTGHGRAGKFHTDEFCHRLQLATDYRPMDADDVPDDCELCRVCAGEVGGGGDGYHGSDAARLEAMAAQGEDGVEVRADGSGAVEATQPTLVPIDGPDRPHLSKRRPLTSSSQFSADDLRGRERFCRVCGCRVTAAIEKDVEWGHGRDCKHSVRREDWHKLKWAGEE